MTTVEPVGDALRLLARKGRTSCRGTQVRSPVGAPRRWGQPSLSREDVDLRLGSPWLRAVGGSLQVDVPRQA